MNTVTLTYRFEPEDLVALYRHAAKTDPAYRKARTNWIALISVCLFVVFIATFRRFDSWADIVIPILTLIILVATPFWYDWRLEKSLPEYAAASNSRDSFGEHKLVLSKENLCEITPATETSVRWSSVSEVSIFGEDIVIIIDSHLGAVINRGRYSGPIPFDEIPKTILDFKHGSA